MTVAPLVTCGIKGYKHARCGGIEVAGWTVDRTIQFDSRHTLTTCGPSNGKEVKDIFGRPGAHVRVGSAH